MVVACKLSWDLCLSDHVPIEVELDIGRYGAEVIAPRLPTAFPEVKWGPKERKAKEQERDEIWDTQWKRIEYAFAKAEAREDVEEMHRL